jgi:hypothetical protein
MLMICTINLQKNVPMQWQPKPTRWKRKNTKCVLVMTTRIIDKTHNSSAMIQNKQKQI